MNPIGRAVWYIEMHFGSEISLAEVAQASGLSKFHLVRAFGTYAGRSVMRYVRARQLSEAAKQLATGSGGILDVALEAGYNSHEAFTRAFKEQFGITPDQFRRTPTLENLKLVEPIKMDVSKKDTSPDLSKPRIVEGDAMVIVGLKKRYDDETSTQMPSQWQAFQAHIGNIDNQKGNVAFGVLCNSDDDGNIDYITGVEVSQYPEATEELDGLRIPAQIYAVFQHEGHVAEIGRTWKAIFADWLPQADYRPVDAPQVERYGEGFDTKTGIGDIEIWIPVAK